jgi:hypothetical protein
MRQQRRSSNSHFKLADTPSRPRGAIRPSFASSLAPLKPRGRREGRVPAAPAVYCANLVKETAQQHTGEAQHTAFPAQWLDGLCRALPGAEFVLASLPPWNSPAPRRLTRMPHPRRLDRSNDGQDHTVLPYARSADHRIIPRRCRRCLENAGETNLTAPLVGTKPRAHGEQSALPTPLAPDAAASTATRLATVTTQDRPSRSSRDG